MEGCNKMQYQGTGDLIAEYSHIFHEMHGKCIYIGCGSGKLLKNIILPKLPVDATVEATDTSEDILNGARKNCANDKKISFSILDIDASRIGKSHAKCYQNVISFYYLQQFQNLKKIFKNISKLLQKNGQGFVAFLCHHDVYDLYLAYRTDPKFQSYMQDTFHQIPALYGCPNAVDIVKDTLIGVNLVPIDCNTREIHFLHKNIDDLKSFLISIDPFVNRMPDAIRDIYIDQISKDLQSELIKEGIVDTYRLLTVHFKKLR